MTSNDLVAQIKGHLFFNGMSDGHIEQLSSCAKEETFTAGQQICNVGEDANRFYVIFEGQITVDASRDEGPAVSIQTLGSGDVLGWSWLFAPHEWLFGAHATSDCRVLIIDAHCLRAKCEEDPALGYDLMMRFSSIVVSRLGATRVQLLEKLKTA